MYSRIHLKYFRNTFDIDLKYIGKRGGSKLEKTPESSSSLKNKRSAGDKKQLMNGSRNGVLTRGGLHKSNPGKG